MQPFVMYWKQSRIKHFCENILAKKPACLWMLTQAAFRDRPIIGFTDLFNRYRYRLIGIDTHHIGIGKIGIGMV